MPGALLLAGLLLAGVVLGAVLLLRTGREDKALAARIAAVGEGAGLRHEPAAPSLTRRRAEGPHWREVLTGVLGFSLSRKDQYSMAWPWVVVIGLVAGRIAVALGAGLAGDAAWVLQPVVTVMICRTMFKSMRLKRVARLRVQFPDAIGLIVRAVRVGIPVSEALRAVARESVAPTSVEFARLVDQIAIGTPLDQALREMSERNELPEYGFFASALSLQAATGGGLSETLELLADVTRKRVAMKARGHALSAEARTSSMILGALPVVSGLSLYLINPDYIGLLFTEESGRMVLGGAVLSLGTGVFVMRMIIRRSLG